MLSFAVYDNGQPAEKLDMAGAYVVGTDDVPLRAELTFSNGVITCKKRAAGPAGLSLMWTVPDVGRIMLETARVPERDKPYILQVELARARLMRVIHKLEEWGLADGNAAEAITAQIDQSREMLIRALQADTPADAAAVGDQALALCVQVGEALSRHQAAFLLGRRKQAFAFSRRVLGCSMPVDKSTDVIRKRVVSAFDFVTVPIVWRDIEPSEQTFNWKSLDTWVETLNKLQIPIRGSALLSFHESQVPDWLYIWEHDFDTIRDVAFEHVRRVINRYGQYIQSWNVISGIHANNCFTFNFEQLMELTRMTAALTKQIARRSVAVIELVAPWGEYYARNQRTIPPLLYADMAVQSGVNFDAFGLKFYFGAGIDGMFVRDMFQISSLLDLYAKLGKPIHVTAAQVPSASATASDSADAAAAPDGGSWGGAWSEDIQAQWLERFLEVTLSKPFVETVSWHGLSDESFPIVPFGGLLHPDLSPKPAYETMVRARMDIQQFVSKDGEGTNV